MRIITWNSGKGLFRKKAKYIGVMNPDVLVTQEITRHDEKLEFDGNFQPTFRDWVSLDRPGGDIGVYSFTNTQLAPVASDDPIPGFHLYTAQRGDLSFQVVAVWSFFTRAKETRNTQIHDGLRRYGEWIAQKPTVIMGDFNDNGSFNNDRWRNLLDLMEPLGMASAYHRYFGEAFGEETRPTYQFHWSEEAVFHVNYVFMPEDWAQRITKVQVGDSHHWNNLSDHMPVIVDLDL
ncbi:MAG: hypothetical protein ACOX8V_03755 [Thermoleophilia bacterium]